MEIFDRYKEKCFEIKTDPFYAPYVEELKNAYSVWKDEEIPLLEYKDFNIYFETGSRSEYESKYFERRRRLAHAVMLYILFEEREYLNKICELVWAICGEISWAVPAHLARERTEAYRKYIDLFAAETAFSLAELAALLKDKLPQKIYDLIICEVTERIFDSYEERPHFWEKLISNWPGVCASNVGCAYILLAPQRFEKVKERIFDNLNQFIKSYGEDGSNTEGISYWQFGFWNYLNFADLLWRYSNHSVDLRHGGKIDKMATFLPKMALRKNIVISFSDGSRSYPFKDIGLYNYILNNYDDVQIPAEKPDSLNIARSSKLAWILRDFFWSDVHQFDRKVEFAESFEYLSDAQWYVVKKRDYSFAAKAGHNNEGHNHNDVGSFIFADDNGQILADLGAMEYTAKSFSNLRYTILSNSSLGHSVPIVNGKAQKDGATFKAVVLKANRDVFSMELQNAYENEQDKIIRTFTHSAKGITLADRYEKIKENTYIERFVSIIKPKCLKNGVQIGNAVLRTKSAPDVSSQVIAEHNQEPLTVWLLDYAVTENEFKMDIEVLK